MCNYVGVNNALIQVYWLPPEAGEKVSLGVMVLLAFSVFQTVISESTPENSDFTPLLSQYTETSRDTTRYEMLF